MTDRTTQTDETKLALMAQEVGYVSKAMERVEKKLDDMNTSHASIEQHLALSKRVAVLEGWNTWIVRIVVSGVLLGLLALLGIKS